MSLFQLDPASIAARTRAAGQALRLPALPASMFRGLIGFTILSILGFLPWPIMDYWFPFLREGHLYVACTAIFIGLSGPCLHRLILGPGSMSRFYKLFALAFIAYAVVWVGFWMAWRGDAGSLAGLFGGAAVMCAVLALAFDAPRAFPLSVAALFLLNTAGFYLAGWIEGKILLDHRLASMFLWALFWGLGFGAGLGAVFHFCQARARELLRAA
ncbi:MAG TPA: hypothetical protein VGM54_22485 [Chthoniobacter sp.]|jgi:hypothetical protein